MPLSDYQDIVGATAGAVTIAQFFSPIFICKQIVNQGNTANVDSTPFVGGIGMGLLMLRHGYLLDDPTMTVVNIAALILNTVYLLVYITYSNDKGAVFKNIFKTLAAALLIIAYTVLDWSPNRVLTVYGSIVTLVMFALIGAPLRDLKEIIRTKNTGSMPFPMIVSGEITLSLWLLYGIIINNFFIIVIFRMVYWYFSMLKRTRCVSVERERHAEQGTKFSSVGPHNVSALSVLYLSQQKEVEVRRLSGIFFVGAVGTTLTGRFGRQETPMSTKKRLC